MGLSVFCSRVKGVSVLVEEGRIGEFQAKRCDDAFTGYMWLLCKNWLAYWRKIPVTFCGGHGSSTIMWKTKFLSNENLAGLTGGVFVVFSVESSHKTDVREGFRPPILWTCSPAQTLHFDPFFSFCAIFLCFLWTFSHRSKGLLIGSLLLRYVVKDGRIRRKKFRISEGFFTEFCSFEQFEPSMMIEMGRKNCQKHYFTE